MGELDSVLQKRRGFRLPSAVMRESEFAMGLPGFVWDSRLRGPVGYFEIQHR